MTGKKIGPWKNGGFLTKISCFAAFLEKSSKKDLRFAKNNQLCILYIYLSSFFLEFFWASSWMLGDITPKRQFSMGKSIIS